MLILATQLKLRPRCTNALRKNPTVDRKPACVSTLFILLFYPSFVLCHKLLMCLKINPLHINNTFSEAILSERIFPDHFIPFSYSDWGVLTVWGWFTQISVAMFERKRKMQMFQPWCHWQLGCFLSVHKGALLPFTSWTGSPHTIFHFLFLQDDIIHEMKLCYFL